MKIEYEVVYLRNSWYLYEFEMVVVADFQQLIEF